MADDKQSDLWLTDIEVAKSRAREETKPILANFTGSDWCGWCIKLEEEVFSEDVFKDYAREHLVLLKIDFPRHSPLPENQQQANHKLAQLYQVPGFPCLLILNQEGHELARTGYQPGGAEKYVEHLKGIISDLAS